MSDRQERIPMQPGEYLFYTVNPDEIREKIRCSDFGFPEEWTAQEEQKEIRICVDKLLSDQGATCMVYEGTLSENGRKVIVKEFYPCSRRNVWAIGRSQDRDQKLRIPRMTRVQNQEFAQRCRQFLRSYLWQKKFYSEAQFLEIVVEPQALAVYGDTCYIVSDYHNGVSMAEQAGKFRTLKEKIFLCQYLADVLSILEENGYLFLDLCEENFLMILQTKSRYQLRMFDMDSIIDLNDLDNLHQAEGNIFYHPEYASGEILSLEKSLLRNRFDDIKKDYLEESVAVYSLGVLFFKILLGHVPSGEERKGLEASGGEKTAEALADTFGIRPKMARKLTVLLGDMLSPQDERYQRGVPSCARVLERLNAFAEDMSYETYVSQRKIAEANSTFAAYNMLQKHPLFSYSDIILSGEKGHESRVIKAALCGSHMMRNGFLSALISIGQMLNTRLEVSLVSEDAEEFWNDYTSEERNAALKRAVVWEINGRLCSAKTDEALVARPLAYLHIRTDPMEKIPVGQLIAEGYRYFIFLDEKINLREIRKMFGSAQADCGSEGKNKQKICAGYLQTEELSMQMQEETWTQESGREKSEEILQWHSISAACFSEVYSEKMYEEQVYKMGLMAHAYYRGWLRQQETLDMEQLEQEYRNDIYSRLSSERSALHGIYKMASIGVDRDRPGRFRAYFEKISDAQTVEKLGWLEHLSWTAHMLTTGNVPVPVSEFDCYAYRGGNNWKDLSMPGRVRHPLLTASRPEKKLPDRDWQLLSRQKIEGLDPLDTASYRIYQWYRGQRPTRRQMLEQTFEENFRDPKTGTERIAGKAEALLKRLRASALACTEHMGDFRDEQAGHLVDDWKTAVDDMEKFFQEPDVRETAEEKVLREFLQQLKDIMRPVTDSYQNRDYKQIDRDLVYSVLDLTMV